MTSIIGNLQDSGLGVFDARLLITLDGLITIETTPKTLLVPKTRPVEIDDGVIDFSLEETETDGVTYRFELYEVDGSGDLILPVILDFHAIVPNESSVDFADLAPTGFLNSQIDSGAVRISKLIVTNPFFSSGIKNLSKPAVSVSASAVQISTLTTTAVVFNLEDLDTNGVWDGSTKLTVPAGFGGTFSVSGLLPISNASGSDRVFTVGIRKNASTISSIARYEVANGKTLDCMIPQTLINLVAGDFIELVVTTTGGFSYSIEVDRRRLNLYRLAI